MEKLVANFAKQPCLVDDCFTKLKSDTRSYLVKCDSTKTTRSTIIDILSEREVSGMHRVILYLISYCISTLSDNDVYGTRGSNSDV